MLLTIDVGAAVGQSRARVLTVGGVGVGNSVDANRKFRRVGKLGALGSLIGFLYSCIFLQTSIGGIGIIVFRILVPICARRVHLDGELDDQLCAALDRFSTIHIRKNLDGILSIVKVLDFDGLLGNRHDGILKIARIRSIPFKRACKRSCFNRYHFHFNLRRVCAAYAIKVEVLRQGIIKDGFFINDQREVGNLVADGLENGLQTFSVRRFIVVILRTCNAIAHRELISIDSRVRIVGRHRMHVLVHVKITRKCFIRVSALRDSNGIDRCIIFL